jgi:hypothetical protein
MIFLWWGLQVTWISPEPGQIAQKVSYNDGLNVKLTDQFQRRAHQLYVHIVPLFTQFVQSWLCQTAMLVDDTRTRESILLNDCWLSALI